MLHSYLSTSENCLPCFCVLVSLRLHSEVNPSQTVHLSQVSRPCGRVRYCAEGSVEFVAFKARMPPTKNAGFVKIAIEKEGQLPLLTTFDQASYIPRERVCLLFDIVFVIPTLNDKTSSIPVIHRVGLLKKSSRKLLPSEGLYIY